MGCRSGGDRSSISPVGPTPNRLLFAMHKRPPPPPSTFRLPSRTTGKNCDLVVAELDTLLTKVNDELIKKMESETEEESLPEIAESSILSASSQPFHISNHETEDTVHKSKKMNDLRPKEDLISDVESLHVSPLASRGGHNQSMDKERQTTMNMSITSLDDDDLFNESFLRSTQALEDAILNRDIQGTTTPRRNRVSPLSRIRRKTPVVLTEQKEKSLGADMKSKNDWMSGNDDSDPPISDTAALRDTPPTSGSNPNPEKEISSVSILSLQSVSSRTINNSQVKSNFCPDDVKNSTVKPLLPKQNKPRATFQLDAPDASAFGVGDPFRRKCLEKVKSVSDKEQNHSVDDCALPLKLNGAHKETFTRSKSETAYHARTSDHRVSQEFDDDDDEIFASLMPALIEVEAEHCKGLISDDRKSSSGTNYSANVNKPLKKSSVNTSRVVPSSKTTTTTTQQRPPKSQTSCSTIKINKNYKTLILPDTKHQEAERSHRGDTNLGSQKAATFSAAKFDSSSRDTSSRDRNENVDLSSQSKTPGAAFEDDDDDDIFLQEGVLDYISMVESQYVSSQNVCDENASRTNRSSPAPAFLLEPLLSTQQSLKDSQISRNPSNGRSSEAPELHFTRTADRGERATKSFAVAADTGSNHLKKELMKVGETAAKLNKALMGRRTESCSSAPDQNELHDSTLESMTDEEFLGISLENSGSGKTGLVPEPIRQQGRSLFQSHGTSYARPVFQRGKQLTGLGSRITRSSNLNQGFSRPESTWGNGVSNRNKTSIEFNFHTTKKLS